MGRSKKRTLINPPDFTKCNITLIETTTHFKNRQNNETDKNMQLALVSLFFVSADTVNSTEDGGIGRRTTP